VIPPVNVSVVIATRNRAASLERLLNSLEVDSSPLCAEIVVVDNGSCDETRSVLARAQSGSRRRFTVVTEDRPGSSRARNRGVEVAKGEILAFTDDDAVVRDGWLSALCGAFDEGIGAVGGRVLPKVVGTPPRWLADLEAVPLLLWDFGAKPFEMKAGRALPLGVNMAVHRSALPSPSEPFDTRLGHRPGLSMGWEETDLMIRILKRHRIVYEPSAVVEHVIDATAIDYARLRRSFFQNGFGRARLERLRGEVSGSYLGRVVLAARTYRWASSLTRKNRQRTDTSSAQAQEEFLAYRQAGQRIEAIFARAPTVSDWCAQHFVPS
jgi:glycosyltransferase involved in cell wall biosynthesis